MIVIDNGENLGIDFKDSNANKKAFVRVNKTNNGSWYMQYHDARGYKTSYIHEVANGKYVTEDGLKMPRYIHMLINIANNFIKKYEG